MQSATSHGMKNGVFNQHDGPDLQAPAGGMKAENHARGCIVEGGIGREESCTTAISAAHATLKRMTELLL